MKTNREKELLRKDFTIDELPILILGIMMPWSLPCGEIEILKILTLIVISIFSGFGGLIMWRLFNITNTKSK